LKAKEVHKLSDEEIDVEVVRLRRRSFELRTQAVTEKIEDTSQFASTRADIARLLTEKNSRRIKVRDEIAGQRS
jgi:ribosomal protein L29